MHLLHCILEYNFQYSGVLWRWKKAHQSKLVPGVGGGGGVGGIIVMRCLWLRNKKPWLCIQPFLNLIVKGAYRYAQIIWNCIFLRNRILNKNFELFPSSVLFKVWSCKLMISSQPTVCSKLLLRIAMLMESILFLKINDCYTFPYICCLPLQQIFFIYQFKREVFVRTGSLLLQHIHSVCVCRNMSQ